MNKLTLEDPVQGPPAPVGSPAPAAHARARSSRPAQAQAPRNQPANNPTQDKSLQDHSGQEETTPGKTAQGQSTPGQPPRLSAAVLAQIANALRQGGPDAPPLAAQADLVALHKRIAEMFATLNEGLGAQAERKAAADRAALSTRIDQLEEAVNRMEGALRIEFEPVLKATVAEALAQAAPTPRRRWRGALAAALLAGTALAAGAWWHAPLQDKAQALGQILTDWTGFGPGRAE